MEHTIIGLLLLISEYAYQNIFYWVVLGFLVWAWFKLDKLDELAWWKSNTTAKMILDELREINRKLK